MAASPAAFADATPEAERAEAASLSERDSRSFDELRVDAALRLADYTGVFIKAPTVAFQERWQRDQNRHDKTRVTDRDVERIRGDVSRLLQDVLTNGFSDAGLAIAEAPAAGVLVVEAAIVDLNIVAPDTRTATRTFTYSDSAGSMTLVLRLRDGGSDRLLLSLNDHRRDPQRGFLEWRTRPYNTHIARLMMRRWTDDLIAALDQAPWLAATP